METTRMAARPVKRGSRVGLYFPVCRVCGRDHHREATYVPSETSPEEWADTVRVNEACDACWLWFVSTEDGWMTS